MVSESALGVPVPPAALLLLSVVGMKEAKKQRPET
jgi:hypothetical protein